MRIIMMFLLILAGYWMLTTPNGKKTASNCIYLAKTGADGAANLLDAAVEWVQQSNKGE